MFHVGRDWETEEVASHLRHCRSNEIAHVVQVLNSEGEGSKGRSCTTRRFRAARRGYSGQLPQICVGEVHPQHTREPDQRKDRHRVAGADLGGDDPVEQSADR